MQTFIMSDCATVRSGQYNLLCVCTQMTICLLIYLLKLHLIFY